MLIRPATDADEPAMWAVMEPIIRAGETYMLPRDMPEAATLHYWRAPSHLAFVLEEEGRILGTYYLRANQQGGGAHVANCGYMTAPAASGRGIAKAMCLHSLEEAKSRGFRAIQFNCVIATNERAIRLWQSLGFTIVGTVPEAFAHPTAGFVDAHVMYRKL